MRLPRLSPSAYHAVTRLALVAMMFIIVTGGLVRLTGSGLGCTDWPTCQENQLVADWGQPHAVVEFVNRMITGLVSVAVILAVLGSLIRQPRRRDLTWWSLGLVAGVVGQIVLGGITVLVGLKPPFVMGHFLLSIALVWNGVVLHHRAGGPGTPAVPLVSAPTRMLSRIAVGWALVVLVTGTVVTGAGPHGGDQHVERLPWAISTVARVHGVAVLLFLGLAVVLLRRLVAEGAPRVVDQRARTLVGAILAQAAIGYAQYFLGVPVGLVALHLLGATLVWVAVLALHLNLWARPAARPDGGEGLETGEEPAAARPDLVTEPFG